MTKAWANTRISELLDIPYPIIQAPMAGASTPKMVAAASNAGVLGSHGCTGLSIDALQAAVGEMRSQTNRSINLNFFVHKDATQDEAANARSVERLKAWYDKYDAGDPPVPSDPYPKFDQSYCDLLITLSPKVVSFHFGLPAPDLVHQIKDAGIVVISSATSAAEARWLEEHGADAIIAQGYEAGGHSGWFLDRGASQVAGTMALVPRIVDTVDVPVIAAGGIADGRGIAAAFMLGAEGVQIGTAFLASPESAYDETFRAKALSATGDDTMYSQAFSGRNARTITNEFSTAFAGLKDWPEFPLMNGATGKLRAVSAKAGDPEAMSLWSGMAVGLMREEPTEQIVKRLIAEVDKILNK